MAKWTRSFRPDAEIAGHGRPAGQDDRVGPGAQVLNVDILPTWPGDQFDALGFPQQVHAG